MMPQDDDVLGLADTSTTQVGDLIPEDVYSTLVLDALYAQRRLAGIVSAVREDLTARPGDTVQVPYIGARTAQQAIAEGSALTATATSTGTYPITIEKHGDYDRVNAEVFEDQDVFNEDAFLRNMAGGLAELVDQLVMDELETLTPGSTVDLGVAGTLTDLYDKIMDLKAAMEKLKVRPTHVIIGPDQNAALLKDTDEGTKLMQIQATAGLITNVGGLEAIVTPLANANAVTANLVQAVVIDRSRAIGEAWGRRPTRLIDRVTDAPSDKVRLIEWIRYGTESLDLNATGHVLNP